ncbi:response regulator [Aquabacterium sp. OR-4]|uniref:response regulator n=1 Tax=Aquabacterium sp. OR-4 TaxID=2978127 RepID=UPI0021B1D594|nr:response regulator [Aquabacterium sp. OR-4]MDT7836182.1 response regulator [Aquabacterium sp. OR-4]
MAEAGSNGISSSATHKGRILVVDDDRLVLATVTHGLAQAGYEVIDADNGDDAILLARQHRPELALLDIRMEGKSGFDVAAYLREYLHTPFMFLSAFADEETVQQVTALGAVAYLVKPLDIGQILPTVEAAFANLPHRRGDVAAPVAAVAPAQPGLAAASPSPSSSPSAPVVPAQAAASMAAAAVAHAAVAHTAVAHTAVAHAPRGAPLDPVPVAVGVLMHRYSLQRHQALERLQRLAGEERRSLAEQAERLVDAVELLARGQG